MQHAECNAEEPQSSAAVAGPKPGPSGEAAASKSGSVQLDSLMLDIKEEAAGDTSYASSIDAMCPDPSDSFPGGLFPGSFDWSSPDSISEGRNIIGGVEGQEVYDERASRPGNSRIPGKDHRRYYHNHWRLEYLMDFNARCHSMICMVCGSSLATLKLSTIKRHIRQKHPYSLFWTPCEKEVIIGSWDAHLCVDAQTLAGSEEHVAESMKARTGPVKKRRRLPTVAKGIWRPVLGPALSMNSPLNRTQLEQYMNESLQQWFRLEFLIDYDYQGNQLHCMMCSTILSSLSLTDIKHHILDNHPTSLQFSPIQKSVIVDAWINRKETPQVDEEDETPDMEDNKTPDVEDKANKKLAEKDVSLTCSPLTTTESSPENSIVRAKNFGDLLEKDIQCVQHLGEENNKSCSAQLMKDENLVSTDLKHLEEQEPKTGDVQLLGNKEWNAKEVHLLAAEERKARKKPLLGLERQNSELQSLEDKEEEKHEAMEVQFREQVNGETKSLLLKEEQKTRERQLLEEQERIGKAALLEEEMQKAMAAQLVEDTNGKPKEVQLLEEERRKAKEALLLEAEKKTKEAELLKEEKRKAKETQLLEEEKRKAKEAQLIEEENKKAQLLEEENSKTREAQLLQERGGEVGRKLKQETFKEQETRLKEDQGMSNEGESEAGIVIVKMEDHQYAIVPKDEKDGQAENHVPPEKQQIHLKMVEDARTPPSEPATHIIQVQQVPQAPAVLGIGLPVLKMKAPSPIIITRVSVVPEHTILQTSKPKPSTSASDISKTWRVIAPKVNPSDGQNPTATPVMLDLSQSPAGVDPTVWEVSMWRGNIGSVVQNNGYNIRWRSEYLMDFNGVRGSVVCMYCSSSLTVLKESSIKRHISQKHPHTDHFSAEEKAAVILDWENKLCELKKMSQKPKKGGASTGDKVLSVVKVLHCDPVKPDAEESSWSGVLPENKNASWDFAFGRVEAKVMDPRKYQHDRWKLEFLMDYTPAKDGLICMVCGVTLMNPKITTVKMHIQQKHPDTTYLSDQEKAVVMEEWEQKMVAGQKAAEQQNGEDEICIEINEDLTTTEANTSSVAASSPRPDITIPTFSKTPKSTPSLPPPCNSAKPNYKVRWRTEYMMDYDCRRQGLICMVCGGTLATLKVSTIRRHIVQVHPYSVDFTAEERQRILGAYSEMAIHYIHSEECFKTQAPEEVRGRKRKSTSVEESQLCKEVPSTFDLV